MSKPIISQPIMKTSCGNILTSMSMTTNTVLNPPLQIQPKPMVTVLQNQNQSRMIQSQPTFAIQPNNQYLTNIQPNFNHAAINRTQTYNMAANNSFTFTLAPIQAKPIESPTNSSNLAMIPSNFPPIQMRPNNNTAKQAPVALTTTSVNMTSAAAGGYYRDWILEAIDKLRERKARPDAERISTLMKRYHNIPLEDTVMCLNKLADSGSVVCVDYKGNISYRNPYKWRKNSANGGGIMNPPSITNRILEAFRHLDKNRGTDLTTLTSLTTTLTTTTTTTTHKNGYSIAEVEQALTATQAMSSVELTKTQLRHCLEREAAYGKLMRRSDCTYVIDENGEKKMRKAAAIQAKKSALAHKPIVNKSIAAAPQSMSMTTPTNLLTTLSSNPNPFTSFSVQAMPSFTPQMTQFVTTNERQILPLMSTTSTTFNSMTLTPLSQPSPILPKQVTPQMPILKCEASSPSFIPGGSMPTIINTTLSPVIITEDSTTVEAQSHDMTTTTTSSIMTSTPLFEIRTTTKTSRRGRPPGSKNKRYQESDNVSTQPTKKQKIDSDNHITNVSAGSSCSALSISNSDQTVPATGSVIELCSECKGPQTDYDKFLCCKDCTFKVHPACLHYWPELTERARQSQWQCSLCKTCSICNDRGSKESVYICDGCDKGFHPNCHEPKILEPVLSNAAWICCTCHSEGFRIKVEETTATNPVENVAKVTVDKSESKNFADKTNVKVKQNTNDDDKSKLNGVKGNIRSEEVGKWSVDEVCEWLTEEGFGFQSGSFREQEIDGACLLLMKRIDVLTELNIKLGPAVKIYEKIKKIQNDGSIWRYDDCF